MTIFVFIHKVCRRVLIYYKKVINRILIVSEGDRQKLFDIERSFPNVLSTSETLKRIVEHNLSICRYGDAEFDVMDALNQNDYYQKPSAKLSNRLLDILEYSSDESILVCIPPFNSPTNNIQNYYRGMSFWQAYWLRRFTSLAKYLIHPTYGNSFISRDTVFYENNLNEIKKIWEGKKVIFVYGRGGRFNVNSSLFNKIAHSETVLVPPSNAFDEYDDIIKNCLAFPKDYIFIIAAGPAATVLAFDLAQHGYQALDLGHITNCYDQYQGIMPPPEDTPLITKKDG